MPTYYDASFLLAGFLEPDQSVHHSFLGRRAGQVWFNSAGSRVCHCPPARGDKPPLRRGGRTPDHPVGMFGPLSRQHPSRVRHQ